MSCKVVLVALCTIVVNEALLLRPSARESLVQEQKFIHDNLDEDNCVNDQSYMFDAPDEGYGINGGDQSGWAPPADTWAGARSMQKTTEELLNRTDTYAFEKVKRNFNPSSMLGAPIMFPSADPTCEFGLPSADKKVCCSAACWKCMDDAMCADPQKYEILKGQSASLCCTGRIQSNNLGIGDSCDTNKPPCMLSKNATATLQGPITDWKHARNKDRISMYECRRVLFFEAKVHLDKAQSISGIVWTQAHLKIVAALEREIEYKKNIANATKKSLVGSKIASTYVWKDGIESAKEEVRFYAEIRRNAIWVHENATMHLNTVDELKYACTNEEDKSDDYQPHLKALKQKAWEAKEHADLLWQQWEDSSKGFDCEVPTVLNAKSQCKTDNSVQRHCPTTCKPGYDGPEMRNGMRCLKKGAFGKKLFGEMYGMAVCPPRNCGRPSVVPKTTVLDQDILFPYAAHYMCLEGYSLTGQADGQKSFELACGVDGKLENLAAALGTMYRSPEKVCEPIKCGEAPLIEHAHTHKMLFVYTNVAPYKCVEGYTTDGTAGGMTAFEASCLSSGEFSATPSCLPVRCGPAPEFEHTTLVTNAPGDVYFPQEIEYNCKRGYTLDQKVGGPARYTLKCYPSGELSLKGQPGVQVSATQCRPVSAGMAPKIDHAQFVAREMFYGDSEIISADSGYSVEALPHTGFAFTLSATWDGVYSGLDTFKPVLCGAAPAVANCQRKADQRVLEKAHYGDSIFYQCADGYSFDATPNPESSNFTVNCEADGSFSKIPGRETCANIDDCADHTCGPHGSCVDKLLNYSCACDSGFQEVYDEMLEERVCGNIDDCGPEACGIGKCVDLVNDYKCDCPSGYFQQTDGEEHTCAPVLCGTPPEIANALTQPLEKQFAKSYFLDSVLYQCAAGYTMDGTVTGRHGFKIDCLATSGSASSGSFGPSGSCKPISCGSVPAVEFATSSMASGVYGQNVTYTCKEGYSADGTATGDKTFQSQCLVSGAFSPAQQCTRILCGEPDDIANSHRAPGNKRFGDVVKYKCFDGYIVSGVQNSEDKASSFETKCQKNGKFSRPVSSEGGQRRPMRGECKPKVCGKAWLKINALNAAVREEIIHYPAMATVKCQDGYTVGGSPKGKRDFTVKCGADGLFAQHNQNSCQPIQCGPLPTMKDASFMKLLGPGRQPSSLKTLAYSYKAYYKCRTGFTAGGEPDAGTVIQAGCSDQGEYSLPADDLQCVNVNDCAGHTCGPHGTCVDQIGPAPAYTCNCEAGFELTTTSDGEKMCGNIDDCGGKSCGAGVCKDLVGDYTCLCPAGYYLGFKDNAKTCLPVRCAASPPRLTNGRMLSTATGVVEFPQTLRYKCNPGYSTDGSASLGKREFQSHCGPHGRMSSMFSCQKVKCGLPKVLPLTTLSRRVQMSFNDRVVYSCASGYSIGGRPSGAKKFTVKCLGSGAQSPPKHCAPVSCGSAPRIHHATISSASTLRYGMSVRYQCARGYTLNGRASGPSTFHKTCQASGRFSGVGGQCKPVSAGRLPQIPNAHLMYYGGRRVSRREVAYFPAGFTYKCRPGYTLTGQSGSATVFRASVNSIGSIVPSLPQSCKRIVYTVNGQAKDARTGRSIAGVTVTLVGTGRTTSARNGFFSFSNVPRGDVTLKFSKTGYIHGSQHFFLVANMNNGGSADINMSPRMSSSQWRATIKWDATPRDLDTYVKWGWSKVYYGSKYRSASQISAKLEADDTNGHGPETAYMTGVGRCRGSAYKCDIKYMINDYSRTGRMPNYRGEVTLYTGSRIAGKWKLSNCPQAVSSNKNWWHVFTIDGKTNRLKWHCGQGSRGQVLLAHSAGSSANSTAVVDLDSYSNSTAAVDFESYVGPFPGRYFRHSQHKKPQSVQAKPQAQQILQVPQNVQEKEEIFRFPAGSKVSMPRLRASKLSF